MEFTIELDQKRPIVPCMFTSGSTEIPNAMALFLSPVGSEFTNDLPKKRRSAAKSGERTMGIRAEIQATPKVPRQSLELERSNWRIIILIGATLLIWIGFHIWTGVFITPRNLSNLAVQTSITALIAAGLCWLLVAREIDLSVGSLLAMCSVLSMILLQKVGLDAYTTILLVTLTGIGVGLLQGGLRVLLGIPSFIITLAGFSWLRGLAYVFSGAETLSGTGETFYMVANGELSAVASLVGIVVCTLLYMISWVRAQGNRV